MHERRCPWANHKDALLRDFHDHEWGEPVPESGILFEYLVLHTFQIGFDFPVVLRRREDFREVLAGFDPDRIARFSDATIEELLLNPRILRNRRKLVATRQNAQAWVRLRQELGGEQKLLPFFYGFVGGKTIDNQRSETNPIPLTTPQSEALSKDLKRRGFSMTGPATCYNIMQTAGLVNDHWVDCPLHRS